MSSALGPKWAVVTNSNSQGNDFLPTASLENLRLRDALLRKLRAFFHERDFVEVTTPTLSRDTVVDRHIDPFIALPHGGPLQENGAARFLQTSPEFLMKRLLASGAFAIFQICPAYRVDESGPLHNPEFTIVEWYRCDDDMQAGIALLSELANDMLGLGTAQRVSYRAAFQTHTRLDPLLCDLEALRAVVSRPTSVAAGCKDAPNPADLDRDGCLEWLFLDRIQPHLQQPTVIYDYPASQAALAQIREDPGQPPVAERFELFAQGVELANGYHELLDACELRRRNGENNRLRIADGKVALPATSRVIDAMELGMPRCAGVALGFDRLAMLVAGCESIDEIIAFPFDRA